MDRPGDLQRRVRAIKANDVEEYDLNSSAEDSSADSSDTESSANGASSVSLRPKRLVETVKDALDDTRKDSDGEEGLVPSEKHEDEEEEDSPDVVDANNHLKESVLLGRKPGMSETDTSQSEHTDSQQTLASVSFGALASAQKSLNRKRKQDNAGPEGNKRVRSASPFHEEEERRAGRKISHPDASARPSKHAPAEMSSKKAVSRKRQVIAVPKVEARDPRFSSLSGSLDVNRINQKYAFLNDYRASEIADLKQRIRETKNIEAKEALKRELRSMEDRERARQRADEEKAVIREHRKGEREKIKQGKKPFFLKQGDVKKQALVKRFESMSEKKAEKVMEKRRKKKAKKEKKAMPRSRRVIDQ